MDRAARRPPEWLRVPIGLIAGGALLICLVTPVDTSTGVRWLLKALGFVVFVFVAAAYVYFRHGRLLQQTSRNTRVLQVEDAQIAELQHAAGADLGVTMEQARLFASAIIEPVKTRLRLVEIYEPSRRALQQTITVDARLDANGADQVLFPITVQPKGELSDNFSLVDGEGVSVPALTYREYLLLAASALRILVAAAYRLQVGETLPPEALRAERAALRDIVQRRVPDSTMSVAGAAALGELQAPDPVHLTLARTFTQKLARHYAIVAVASSAADGRLRLTLSRTVIPTLHVSGGDSRAFAWIKGVARIMLGARPVALQIPLTMAGTAQSYHLLVRSEDGLYLGQQDCPDMSRFLADRNEHRAHDVPPPYYRFRRRLGQTYAHFYTRFFPEHTESVPPPKLKVLFFETPPGSTFRALVAAMASAVLVWAVGIGISYGSVAELGTDAPAVLLAFPAVAAAWLGFDQPSRRLLEGTMTSRASLLLTAATSVMASALYILHRTHAPLPNIGEYVRFSVLFVSRPSWAVLFLVATLNTVLILYFYLIRTWTFIQLASRQTARESDANRIEQQG
ncbi:hypothetical protein J2S43_003761 [Catenuloplanes nepalensis]|uniref:Uncharacterized protein n=1 Tax=Catenuloplanes nepalensis TaxID=587533 RepID=A0ABT9MUY3_9ACTN|nr:hypothetical protein [Catenuloplanes nepalensis]MDP9795249.1 hypothetical protein [Catenuloplanes nepalensis]